MLAEIELFFQELQILIELESTFLKNTDELTKTVILILIAWFNLWKKGKKAKEKNSALEKKNARLEEKNADLERRISKLESKPRTVSKQDS